MIDALNERIHELEKANAKQSIEYQELYDFLDWIEKKKGIDITSLMEEFNTLVDY